MRLRWKYEAKMASDITRTPILKERVKLHEDAKRVVEFYCFSHNVQYCQGMLEVLLPFLFMKSNEVATSQVNSMKNSMHENGLNHTMSEGPNKNLLIDSYDSTANAELSKTCN